MRYRLFVTKMNVADAGAARWLKATKKSNGPDLRGINVLTVRGAEIKLVFLM